MGLPALPIRVASLQPTLASRLAGISTEQHALLITQRPCSWEADTPQQKSSSAEQSPPACSRAAHLIVMLAEPISPLVENLTPSLVTEIRTVSPMLARSLLPCSTRVRVLSFTTLQYCLERQCHQVPDSWLKQPNRLCFRGPTFAHFIMNFFRCKLHKQTVFVAVTLSLVFFLINTEPPVLT